MADSPNHFQGGSQATDSTAGTRSPIRTRSKSRRLNQQSGSSSSGGLNGEEEHTATRATTGSLKRSSNDPQTNPTEPKRPKIKASAKQKDTLESQSGNNASEGGERKRGRASSSERPSTSSGHSKGTSSRAKKGSAVPPTQREPRPSRPKAKTTGSCASSRVNKLAAASAGSLGEGSPMSNVDAAQEGTSASFSLDSVGNDSNANPSNAASGSAVSSTMASSKGESESEENEMGRLQERFSRSVAGADESNPDYNEDEKFMMALLEARGLPPHLFGALGPRMQHLLHRSLGSSGASSRAQQLLTGLQSSGDEGQQLQAVMEMCQLLVMGNEDTLAGFPVKQVVPVLINLLKMDHNFDMMNHACRALTYMMEALPRSSTVVVEAVPIFLEKLQVIQCMDVAEQALTALEMLSRRHSKSILHAKGVSACLMYLDFFSINAQRAALAITANCCQNLTPEEFPLVSESIPLLSTRLTHQDKKSVESVCLAFSRLVEGFHTDPKVLMEVSTQGLLGNVQQLLVVTPPLISSGTFVMVVRMLAILCGACPEIAVMLLKLNISETLRYLLLGSSANKEEVELVARTPQELFEITSLIGELMPRLPTDGIFSIDSTLHKPSQSPADSVVWQWKDDRGSWHPYSAIDNKMVEAGHLSGEDEISLSTMGRTYTLDFNAMQQINEDTGTTRPIQRKVNNTSGSSSFHNLPSSDSRADCLQANLYLASSCIKSLFGVLYEVYSSSAGPAVRHKCLRALLRMVYFSPADLLKQILKNQPVSSHVAAMLSSQDLRVVVAALQMAEILMQKLPDIFEVYFRREGVMHQIKWLARMDATSSSNTSQSTSTATNSGEPGASSNNYPSLPTLLGDKSPFLLHNALWPQNQTPPTTTEDENYLSLGQVKFSDVLKRKRTPKRGNTTSRKARTEDSSTSRDSFSFAIDARNSFSRNIIDNPMLGSSMITLGTTSANNTTVSPILCPSTSSATRSGSSGRLATKTTSLLANLNPTRWAKWSNNSRTPNSQEQSVIHKSQQFVSTGNKDKIRAWIKERATKFEDGYFNSDPQSHPALNVLNTLVSALEHLEAMTEGGLKALQDIRAVVIDSDISSFELNHSGLVSKLLMFLTSTSGAPYEGVPRDDRLRTFLHVFLSTPRVNDLNFNWDGAMDPFPMGQLVSKLNACVGQLEQFSVKVHDLAGSAGRGGGPGAAAGGTSALKFFNTHQLKCNLQRHPSCNTLRQWRGGPVKIDPLALVQAIERYLVVRGYGRIRDPEEEDGNGAGGSDDDNSEDDIDDTMAAMMIQHGQGKHKLQFFIGDNALPYNMTVYQAIRQFSESAATDGHETDTEAETPLGYANIWIQTHVIWYRPVTDEPNQSGSASSKSSSHSRLANHASTSGGTGRKGRTSPKKKSDELWQEGIVPVSVTPLNQYLVSSLPASVTVRDPSLEVISLLRVLYGLCNHWNTLYHSSILCPSHAAVIPQSEFVNAKLTAKANRQLQDPLAIMTGNVPSWLSQVAYSCPFIFPFETRHLLFYVSSFDRDRALQRLLDMSPELSSTDSSERVTPRLDRRKKTVSRNDLLKQAEIVIQDMANSKALLEIQYDNEVGTGLGPTLEFYALVSKELQRVDLEIWRGDAVAVTDGKDKTVEYIHSPSGLFPLPMAKATKASHVSKIRQKFKLLGKFMAKALMDSRMLDISLSKAFYRWLLNQESYLCSIDMSYVDPTFAKTFHQLELVAFEKHKLQQDSSLSPTSLKRALEKFTLDGQSIEDLNLDFTLPGPGQVELRKGGKDILLTMDNVEDYVKLVTHWTLVEGVRRQMESFRDGFENIFPLNQLTMFYPHELENLFCGSNNSQWDLKMLGECCKPDHGYAHDSRAIKFLFEILCNQTPQEQRDFLQFVTGSPRLPVGGLKSLTPPLTIVRKTLDTSEDPDDFLPSVMTCVNYLKLPDYTSIEKMREKLKVAVSEGQHSFFLS